MPAVRARSGTPTLTPMPEPVPTLSLEPCQAVPAALLCGRLFTFTLWPPRSCALDHSHAHSNSSHSHSHSSPCAAPCVHIHRGARALLRRGLDVEEEDEEEAPCWALDAHGLYSAAASGTLPTVPSAPAAAPWGHAASPAPAAPWGAVGAAPVPCIHTHTHTVPPGGAVPGAVGAAPVPPGGAVPGGLLPPQGAQHGAAGYPLVPKLPAPQQQPRPGGGVGGVAVPSRPGDAKRQRAR